jgi:hypothetical protein
MLSSYYSNVLSGQANFSLFMSRQYSNTPVTPTVSSTVSQAVPAQFTPAITLNKQTAAAMVADTKTLVDFSTKLAGLAAQGAQVSSGNSAAFTAVLAQSTKVLTSLNSKLDSAGQTIDTYLI